MTANASIDKNASPSIVSSAANKIAESAILIMQMFGIKILECRKIRSADYERIAADVSYFEGAPQELVSCAILVKDNIAAILASAGIVKLEISSEEGDNEKMLEGYESMLENYKSMISSSKKTSGIELEKIEDFRD